MQKDKISSMDNTVQREQNFTETLSTIHEKLTLMFLSIKEKRELVDSEEMRTVLEPIHRAWHEGEYSFHTQKFDLPTESPVQQGLFSEVVSAISQGKDNVADKNTGTEVDKGEEKRKDE